MIIKYGVVRIFTTLSKGYLSDDECIHMFGKIISVQKPKDDLTSWVWKKVKSYKVITIKEDDNLEELEEVIYKKIDETIQKMLKEEKEIFLKLN